MFEFIGQCTLGLYRLICRIGRVTKIYVRKNLKSKKTKPKNQIQITINKKKSNWDEVLHQRAQLRELRKRQRDIATAVSKRQKYNSLKSIQNKKQKNEVEALIDILEDLL